MYDEIKNWFLRESLVFAFELDDIIPLVNQIFELAKN